MEWSYLLLLICPLMMIFMMKGMGGHGHQHHDPDSAKILDSKMSNLELENEKLRKEVDALSSMVKKGS